MTLVRVECNTDCNAECNAECKAECNAVTLNSSCAYAAVG